MNDVSVSVVQVTVWCEMLGEVMGGNWREFQDNEISQKNRKWEIRSDRLRGKRTFSSCSPPAHWRDCRGFGAVQPATSGVPKHKSQRLILSPQQQNSRSESCKHLSVRPQAKKKIRLRKEQYEQGHILDFHLTSRGSRQNILSLLCDCLFLGG